MLVFDIETGPLPEEQLQERFTFTPPERPGEFDPSSVKYGNLKDEAKRAAKLEEARQAHFSAAANYEADCEAARLAAWEDFVSKAALSPATGQVLAIGVGRDGKRGYYGAPSHAEESAILVAFWKKYQQCRKDQCKMVGANIVQFDLPFMIRRSWVLNVSIPATVYTYTGKWINFDSIFMDIRDLWLLGQRWGECESSLDAMARALGCGRKTEGIGGADFARLFNGTEDERKQAVDYLLNDLDLTAGVASRLGIV